MYTAINTPTMKLFHWILDKSASPFPVDIKESGSVGNLKKAIVKENPHMFRFFYLEQLFILNKVDSYISILISDGLIFEIK
jgi:hypothetical protein